MWIQFPIVSGNLPSTLCSGFQKCWTGQEPFQLPITKASQSSSKYYYRGIIHFNHLPQALSSLPSEQSSSPSHFQSKGIQRPLLHGNWDSSHFALPPSIKKSKSKSQHCLAILSCFPPLLKLLSLLNNIASTWNQSWTLKLCSHLNQSQKQSQKLSIRVQVQNLCTMIVHTPDNRKLASAVLRGFPFQGWVKFTRHRDVCSQIRVQNTTLGVKF